MLAFGIGAAIGNLAGGQLGDRLGTRRTIVGSLILGAALLFAISEIPALPAALIGPAFFAVIFLWGIVGWGFVPPQASHLLSLSPANAPLVLSLNASVLYLGVAGGSYVGGLVLQYGSVRDLGWVGALFPLAALVLMAVRSQLASARPAMSRLG
jgi:predicted MFS family arabinose efflux permease